MVMDMSNPNINIIIIIKIIKNLNIEGIEYKILYMEKIRKKNTF